MYKAGSVYYGKFKLSEIETKNKYLIVFHLFEDTCLLTTFTTSQPRSGVDNPVHGHNPATKPYRSYVFKKGIAIGDIPITNIPFSFQEDTAIVPDYGFAKKSISDLHFSVQNLTMVCQLYPNEFIDLIYTLYHSKGTPNWVKDVLEVKLDELS